jgi:hypothetical protein
MLPVTFSRELYFLVEPKTYCFSTIFYQLDNVNEDIRLQLLRDLNWSFNPSNDLQRHQLYKYSRIINKSMKLSVDSKILHLLINLHLLQNSLLTQMIP